MLAECCQAGRRFSQKMSANWHQQRSHSASILSRKSVHVIRQQIGIRNQAKPADRTLRHIDSRNRAGYAAFKLLL